MGDLDLRELWRAHVEAPDPKNYEAWARAAARSGFPSGLELVKACRQYPATLRRSKTLDDLRSDLNYNDDYNFRLSIACDSATGRLVEICRRAVRALRELRREDRLPRSNDRFFVFIENRQQYLRDYGKERTKDRKEGNWFCVFPTESERRTRSLVDQLPPNQGQSFVRSLVEQSVLDSGEHIIPMSGPRGRVTFVARGIEPRVSIPLDTQCLSVTCKHPFSDHFSAPPGERTCRVCSCSSFHIGSLSRPGHDSESSMTPPDRTSR